MFMIIKLSIAGTRVEGDRGSSTAPQLEPAAAIQRGCRRDPEAEIRPKRVND